VIIIVALQLTLVGKQNMAELKLGTYLLFFGIISMLIVIQLKTYMEGSFNSRGGT
jgi:hypothetical protein